MTGVTDMGKTYPVYVHLDLAEDLEGRHEFRQRCNMRFRDMASRGQLTKVKGVAGSHNRGWLRTPVGGNGGNQFYIWFTRTSLPVVPDIVQAKRDPEAFWVRALRHHDDHTPLGFGNPDLDYYPLTPQEIADDDLFTEPPWTLEQDRCARESGKVNLLHGSPGSGKTTTLLKIIEDSPGDSVLFTTWSRELTELAGQYIEAMSSSASSVLLYDFPGLVSAINNRNTERTGYLESQRAFIELLEGQFFSPADYGPWRNNLPALHAEARAVLFGHAIPGAQNSRELPNGLSRLKDKEYLSLRGRHSAIGRDASSALLRILKPLFARDELVDVFPELSAAADAIRKLRSGFIPPTMARLDKLMVDEVQDLTLLEITVLIELLLLARDKAHQMPALYLAGDEGQTILPSGFTWNSLNRLLYKRVGRPREFAHSAHLRNAQRISHILDNTTSLYRAVERGERPSGQRHDPSPCDRLGRVLYIRTKTTEEGSAVIRQMMQDKSLRVATPTEYIPEWLDTDLRSLIRTPSSLKGLEYEKIAVLNPGDILAGIAGNEKPAHQSANLAGHISRTAIDSLRVVVSRATDDLIFMDFGVKDSASELSRKFLGDGYVEVSPELLIEDVLQDDVTPADRIVDYMEYAFAIFQSNRIASWNLILQGHYLCDDTYVDIHRALDFTILKQASLFLFEGVPDGLDTDTVTTKARMALADLQDHECNELFEEFSLWCSEEERSPISLFLKVLKTPEKAIWLSPALASASARLTRSITLAASSPQSAKEFFGDVRSWLEQVGVSGDPGPMVDLLRLRAGNTLFRMGHTGEARRMLKLVSQDLIESTARQLREESQYHDAIFLYDFLGKREEALDARYGLVNILLERVDHLFNEENDAKGALDYCERALAILPHNKAVLETRAKLLYQLGRMSEVVTGCDELIGMLDNHGKQFEILEMKFFALTDEEEFERAVECLEEMLKIDPTHLRSMEERIRIYQDELHDFNSARQECQRMLKVYPDRSEGYRNLAILHGRNGDYEQSMQILDLGIQRGSDSLPLHVVKGALLTNSHQYKAAVEALQEGNKAHPGSVAILNSLGRAYVMSGQSERALSHYTEVVKKEPDNLMHYRLLVAALFLAYTENNSAREYLNLCIETATKGLSLPHTEAMDHLILYDLRALAYDQRNHAGDLALRNADFRFVNQYFPNTHDLKSEMGRKWDTSMIFDLFKNPVYG